MGAWSRVIIGITGLGLAVAGVIAVFVSGTNVAGVPLLILAGAAFLYVALTGQRLIPVSKDGVTFAKVARLEKTLRDAGADPEISYESKERLVDIAEDNGIRLHRPSELELEIQVQEMFQRLGEQYGFTYAARVGDHDTGADFVLTNRARTTLAVETRGRLRIRQFAEAIRTLQARGWDLKMLIVDGGFPEDLATPFRDQGIWIVGWAPDGEERFVETLRQMQFIEG